MGGGRNEKKRRQKREKNKIKKEKGGGKEEERERKEKKKSEKKSTLHQLTRVIVKLLGLLWQSALKVTESAFWVPQVHEAEVISTHITDFQ